MSTVTISKGSLRGKEFTGTYPLINTWFPAQISAHESHLGDGKVIIQLNGKNVGVWVFKTDISIEGQIESDIPTPMASQVVQETLEEMKQRIEKRFNVMDLMTNGIISGAIRSLIISGAAGIGKTYSLDKALTKASESGKIEYNIINGKISGIGLYCRLWECKNENSVLVLDDVDVFSDMDILNLLKAALDTGETRKVCWSTASAYLEEREIDKEFEFKGTIVFITNVDMDRELARGSKLSPHLQALISRSVYLDLGVHTNEEIMIRVTDVILKTDMMKKAGLSTLETVDVLDWMKSNINRLRNVSLRTALYLASFVKTDPANWKSIAEVTQLR